jgi:hypothetical protein
VPCSMKADEGGSWNNEGGTFGQAGRGNRCRDRGVVLDRHTNCCRPSPASACEPSAGCMAGGMLTARAGGARPYVRAVSSGREPCLVPTDARGPTCRWPGPRVSCPCRAVVASVGTPLGPSGCLPSGFPPSSPSVAATVQAFARPYATEASPSAAVPTHGSRAP